MVIARSHDDQHKTCPHNSAVSCSNCRLGSICLPLTLEDDDILKLDEIVRRGRPLQKGEHLYRTGDDFSSVYAVRSGAIKAYHITGDGEEQVTGFYLPGEIVGMDGISKHKYASSAKALETSAVCEIPFNRFEELSRQVPTVQHHFFQLMSQEITTDQQLITLLSKNSADERVASLLVSISARNARRNLSESSFRLPMSRADIGNFLGLTVETISRVVGRFSQKKLVIINNKDVTLLDLSGLKKIANIID